MATLSLREGRDGTQVSFNEGLPTEPPPGSAFFGRITRDQGVSFEVPGSGGVVIPIFDVLYDSKLRAVLMRHEQAAAHAADGYARASGKLGCCPWKLGCLLSQSALLAPLLEAQKEVHQ